MEALMSQEFQIGSRLPHLVDGLVASYWSDERARHIDRAIIPARAEMMELVELLMVLMYPGFFGRQNLTAHNVPYHVGELLPRIGNLMYRQMCKCIFHAEELAHPDADEDPCTEKAYELTMAFLDSIVGVRDLIKDDVQAAYDGDPAATSLDEVVVSYPGLLAISVQRLAHELYNLGVPLMPRFMAEWAHMQTGIDIHPGARIGRSFFIDHGTGVVIGETADIGNHVKIYQGVTLGALSFPRDDDGNILREAKRHPTLKDHVTVYANAIILGGQTVIGEHSVIGGSVFLTTSVPAYSTVTIKSPELNTRRRDGAKQKASEVQQNSLIDFQI
jgi:serine O-acetyltransferase